MPRYDVSIPAALVPGDDDSPTLAELVGEQTARTPEALALTEAETFVSFGGAVATDSTARRPAGRREVLHAEAN